MIGSIKERCVLLFGNNEKIVTGYIHELPETGIATLRPVVCLIPKADIDVRYVAAYNLTNELKKNINIKNLDYKALFERYLIQLREIMKGA